MKRSQLTAMSLISFRSFDLTESVYLNLYLRLYPKSSSKHPVPTDHGLAVPWESTRGLDAAALENGEAVDQGRPYGGLWQATPGTDRHQ